MAEKIKLNKNSLREQVQAVKLYQEFLPTLELRKQQLQSEVRKAERRIREVQERLQKRFEDAKSWAALLASSFQSIRPLVAVREVQTHMGNIAGVPLPFFDKVIFEDIHYSPIGHPPFWDDAIRFWREALAFREESKVLEAQLSALRDQLTKTTQRINLYEKVLIPEGKENIRKIKVYLGDQQTAAVCRAKIAKAKLQRMAEAEAQAQGV